MRTAACRVGSMMRHFMAGLSSHGRRSCAQLYSRNTGMLSYCSIGGVGSGAVAPGPTELSTPSPRGRFAHRRPVAQPAPFPRCQCRSRAPGAPSGSLRSPDRAAGPLAGFPFRSLAGGDDAPLARAAY